MSGGRRHKVHKISTTKLDPPKSDINVTPLVDVVLVLLIIFMVITPMMARGKEVKLPKTSYHYQLKDKQQPVVALDSSYNVWIEKEKLGPLNDATLELLQAKLYRARDKVKDEASKGRVYIKAAQELPYGKVYQLIMTVKEADTDSIDLATNEKDAK